MSLQLAVLLALCVVAVRAPWRRSGLGVLMGRRGRTGVGALLGRGARPGAFAARVPGAATHGVGTRTPGAGTPGAGTATLGAGAASRGRGDGSADDAASGRASVDVVVVLELLHVATRSGASVPRALGVVGQAIGGADGRRLERVANALTLGASWHAAWGDGRETRLRHVREALRGAWEHGAAPGPSLRAAGERLRRGSAARAREAAGRLGVQLVMPVGACLLPAFVLVGLVPVLISLAQGLLGSG